MSEDRAESMVERVARALCLVAADTGMVGSDGKTRYNPQAVLAIDREWPHFVGRARAAIAAMRDPPCGQLSLVCKEMAAPFATIILEPDAYRRAFNGVIEAALAEPGGEG